MGKVYVNTALTWSKGYKKDIIILYTEIRKEKDTPGSEEDDNGFADRRR